MAAPTQVAFVPRGANPGTTTLADSPSVAATGAASTIYFIPTTAENVNVTFKVPSTAAATLEGSCSNPASLAADTANGQWKAISAALTGVTGGAIVLDKIPAGIVAVRVNVGTALAANVATVEISTNNSEY